MSRREPSTPPQLPGFEPQQLIGSGGYADVFRYTQLMPRREVAVKVLVRDALDSDALTRFTEEANAMAALSTHPFIVTILLADVAPDGRPFLVMEYYPGPNFSVRARNERFTVVEVLRVGIQLASAVETAHRSGILHRDLKPANVLTSEYGRPGLTDFGIAAAAGARTEAVGMSVPWSPKEIVDGDGLGDVRADVYSLAATLYTLLAGRSPFEQTHGSNRMLDLVARISRDPLPPTGRVDVPEALERLFRQAMAKQPGDRPPSAEALARALQDVEVEMGLTPTPLEIRTELLRAASSQRSDGDGTRLKAPTVIDPQPRRGVTSKTSPTDVVTATPSAAPLLPGPSADGATVRRTSMPPMFEPAQRRSEVADEGVTARGRAPVADPPAPSSGARRVGGKGLLGLVAAVAAVLVGLSFLVRGCTPTPPNPRGGSASTTGSVPPPPAPEGMRFDGQLLTWVPMDLDSMPEVVVEDRNGTELGRVEGSAGQMQLPADVDCVEVRAVRGGSSSASRAVGPGCR